MKRTTLMAALLIALSISVTAQVKVKGQNNQQPIKYQPRHQPPTNTAPQNNNQPGEHWGHGWNSGHPQGFVSINFGYNQPYYGNPYPYNHFYGNGYSLKKATRYAIRRAGQTINQAVAFDSWNEIYSPLLAKAIRHYDYARNLYWWGNYQAAHNHAERANYLAWYSLQYFQNPGCGYNGGFEPNPYGDPYNPYYKSNEAAGNERKGNASNLNTFKKDDELDVKLPGAGKNDKELIRSFQRDDPNDD